MITSCTLEDVEWLMEDLRNMHTEMSPFGKMADGKCADLLADSIKHHCVLKKVDSGKSMGHMCVRLESHWYTDDLALYEYYIYVKPDYRQTRTAFDLYKTAKGIAQKNNLPFFYGTFRNNKADFNRVHKFLQRQGGEQIGSQFFIGAS